MLDSYGWTWTEFLKIQDWILIAKYNSPLISAAYYYSTQCRNSF